MKLFNFQNLLKLFTNLKFAIFILICIAFISSLGSIIEQDERIGFYQKNYPSTSPIYGFIDWKFITQFGLDHLYSTWWFFFLLSILAFSLISCTITKQFPIFLNAKEYLFKKKYSSFIDLNFFVKLKTIPNLKELLLLKLQSLNFYTYQKMNVIYGYKGLIGRISPIFVHFSLIIILFGASIGAFKSFKAQELLPKGEIFHVQNLLKIGYITNLPFLNIRVNDFWTEYQFLKTTKLNNNNIHQFYSNLSILDNLGNEIKNSTISVNNPLRYKDVDIYQSDWNLLGIRIANKKTKTIFELPLFNLKNGTKSWITWIQSEEKGILTLIFDQFQNTFLIYNSKGILINKQNIGDSLTTNLKIIEILPSTGLLIKYDPSIIIIYFGFGILMLTTLFSYLPYTQIWIFQNKHEFWIGSSTNRGKLQLELQFEELLRYSEMISNRNILSEN